MLLKGSYEFYDYVNGLKEAVTRCNAYILNVQPSAVVPDACPIKFDVNAAIPPCGKFSLVFKLIIRLVAF